MQPVKDSLAQLRETTSRQIGRTWPVHAGSYRSAPANRPVPREQAYQWYRHARIFNRTTDKNGASGPRLHSSALRVYEALIFDFLNFRTGRLDPSYERLAHVTQLARSTIAIALRRLASSRLLSWTRRCRSENTEQGFRLRQETNAYRLNRPEDWLGYRPAPDTPPTPHPDEWGAHPPQRSVLEQAIAEQSTSADSSTQIAILQSDETDDLALALARFGTALLKSENRTETGPKKLE